MFVCSHSCMRHGVWMRQHVYFAAGRVALQCPSDAFETLLSGQRLPSNVPAYFCARCSPCGSLHCGLCPLLRALHFVLWVLSSVLCALCSGFGVWYPVPVLCALSLCVRLCALGSWSFRCVVVPVFGVQCTVVVVCILHAFFYRLCIRCSVFYTRSRVR